MNIWPQCKQLPIFFIHININIVAWNHFQSLSITEIIMGIYWTKPIGCRQLIEKQQSNLSNANTNMMIITTTTTNNKNNNHFIGLNWIIFDIVNTMASFMVHHRFIDTIVLIIIIQWKRQHQQQLQLAIDCIEEPAINQHYWNCLDFCCCSAAL